MKFFYVPAMALSFYAFSVILLTSGCQKASTNANTVVTPPTTTGTSIFYRKLNNSTYANELWAVSSDGTNNQKVAITLPAGNTFDNDDVAKIAPDNKTIVFLGESSTATQIFKCNIDGSNVSAVTTATATLGVGAIEGFIDASNFIYWKETPTSTFELWRINIDGTNNQKINITLPTNTIFDDAEFVKITSDGKTIVFSVLTDPTTATASIYKCNIDGSNVTLITANLGTGFSMQSLANDNTVLYQINIGNANTLVNELWAVNLDGTNNHQITLALPTGMFLMDEEEAVQVSKNGTLFFAGTNNQSNAGEVDAIYTANLDGSGVKLITQTPVGYSLLIQQVSQ